MPVDAIAVLKADHQSVEQLSKKFESTGPRAFKTKGRIVDSLIEELSVHAAIEEQIFYPAVREELPDMTDEILESLEEHHVAKWLCSELEGTEPSAERYSAKATVLIENVRHHVREEESGLFPQVRKALTRARLDELGQQLAAAKESAPRRPYPRLPDSPPANLVGGLAGAALDKVRETIAR